MLSLIVAPEMYFPCQTENKGERVIADGIRVNPSGIREPNTPCGDGLLIELIVADRADLNETQRIRRIEEVVPPET